MSEKQYRILTSVMAGILLVSMAVWGREVAGCVQKNAAEAADGYGESNMMKAPGGHAKGASALEAASGHVEREKPEIKVVIDVGHGGFDPGKVGIDGILEKDINLQIAQWLKFYLEANDLSVVMTREEDISLSEAGTSGQKVQDMKRRIAIMEEADAKLVISIHQNSYPQEKVKGAQVFYYSTSKEGMELAQILQEQLRNKADPDNKRQMKANDSYYLLKKTHTPIVIAECGFLTNEAEAKKLCDENYQSRIAWALCMGILQYLNK